MLRGYGAVEPQVPPPTGLVCERPRMRGWGGRVSPTTQTACSQGTCQYPGVRLAVHVVQYMIRPGVEALFVCCIQTSPFRPGAEALCG